MTEAEIDFICATYITEWDAMQENKARANEQYQKGLELSARCNQITIAINGCWGGTELSTSEDRGDTHISSYEALSYHANTASLLRGFLVGRETGGASIHDYRYHSNLSVKCLHCRNYNQHEEHTQLEKCVHCGEKFPTFIQ